MNTSYVEPAASIALAALLLGAPPTVSAGRDASQGTGDGWGTTPHAAATRAVDRPDTPAAADATAGRHHVYSCDTVNHTWNDIVVPNQPGEPGLDVVVPSYRNACPYGTPLVRYQGAAADAIAAPSATHHVYSCDTVNHTWNDAVVANEGRGVVGDVVEPSYVSACPFGDPKAGPQGPSASFEPYVDSANPLSPSHRFH